MDCQNNTNIVQTTNETTREAFLQKLQSNLRVEAINLVLESRNDSKHSRFSNKGEKETCMKNTLIFIPYTVGINNELFEHTRLKL